MGRKTKTKNRSNNPIHKKPRLKKLDTFNTESFIFKHVVPGSCEKCYCIRRSIFLIELALLIFILLMFAAFALLHFEAQNEISNNVEYIKFIQRIRSTTNITSNDFDTLVNYIGIDPIKGSENFVDYDSLDGTWVAGKSTSFGKVTFFAFTLITSIGYGDFSVTTVEGKLISLFVVLIGLPLAVITYSTFTKRIFEVIMHTVLRNSGEVQAAFSKFDRDNTGELDAEELQQAFAELNLILSLEEVEAFIEDRDNDFSGTLNENEFSQALIVHGIDVSGLAREKFKLWFAVVMLVIWMLVFVFWFSNYDDHTIFDAFWFAIISLTTVGLGDIVPGDKTRESSFFFLFVGLGIMAMLIDALVERGMKVAEHEKQAEERMKQKAAMHRIQQQAVTTTKMKEAYQDEIHYKKKVQEETVKRHRFQRQKQNRKKSLKRRKYDKMKLEIFQEFEDGDNDSEDTAEDHFDANDGDNSEKYITIDSKIEKQLIKLTQWEKSISDDFNVLKHNIIEQWKYFESTEIPSLPMLNHIYDIFANKLLVNEYSHRFPSQISKEYAHRYIKCISLQIVLHQLKAKILQPTQIIGINSETRNSTNTLLTIHGNNKSFQIAQDTEELIGCDGNSTSDEGAVIEYDENHKYHFVCESSDSDLENLEEVHKELNKYALNTKDINLDIQI